MTTSGFRQEALAILTAVESAHMGHPDFRVRGKIFATLGFPDAEWGMVKLTPGQQREFIEKSPKAFSPSRGAWGQKGYTQVLLAAVTKPLLRAALSSAAGNIEEKRPRDPDFKP